MSDEIRHMSDEIRTFDEILLEAIQSHERRLAWEDGRVRDMLAACNDKPLRQLLDQTLNQCREMGVPAHLSFSHIFDFRANVSIQPTLKRQVDAILSLWRTVLGQSPDNRDAPESGLRWWSFPLKDAKGGHFNLDLTVSFQGERCRFEKTEQRIVEEKPVYKLVCESDAG